MRRSSGFTITELMLGLLILGVLMTLAAPSFRDQIRRSAASKVQEDLYADLILARSEAIARARSVTICPVANATAATLDCSTNTDHWNNGWIVLTDTDENSALTDYAATDNRPDDEVIRVYINSSSDVVDIQPNGGSALRYNSRGFLEVGQQSFLFCDPVSGFQEALVVAPGTGRVRYTDGAALTCS